MKNKNNSKRIAIPENTIAAGRRHTVGLKSDGMVTAVGDSKYRLEIYFLYKYSHRINWYGLGDNSV